VPAWAREKEQAVKLGKSETAFRELESLQEQTPLEQDEERTRNTPLATYRITYTDGTTETVEAHRMMTGISREDRISFYRGFGGTTQMIMSVLSDDTRAVRLIEPEEES
jgi:hypothetical protein